MDLLTDDERPYVFFLKGVYPESPSDLNDLADIYADELAECEISDKIFDIIVEDKLPKYFISLAEWPKSTFLHCWFCDSQFSGIPVIIPVKYKRILIEGEEKSVMKRFGNFCSFNCASGYIEYVSHPNLSDRVEERNTYKNMLKMLYQIYYGKVLPEIPPSPHRTCMKIYGGCLDQDQYRTKIDELNKQFESTIKNSKIDKLIISNRI
mgnify:CR=1 FL=1